MLLRSRIFYYFAVATSLLLIMEALLAGLYVLMPGLMTSLLTSKFTKLQQKEEVLLLVASFLFFVGTGLLWGALDALRKRHLKLRLKGTPQQQVTVDTALIGRYVQHYWNTQFPDENMIHSSVSISELGEITVAADQLPIPEEEQQQFIEKVEKELGILFYRLLKYEKEFNLSLSFREYSLL